MAGLSTAGRNERLNDMAADYDTMSLHTGDPADTGANEVVGGSPVYARQPITWGGASAGQVGFASAPVFNCPKSITVTHVGFWKSGVFQGGYALSTAQPFINQGTLTFDSFLLKQPA